jgi:hypothetical protein
MNSYGNCTWVYELSEYSVKFLVGISLVNVYAVSKICVSNGFLRSHQKD